MKPIGSSESSVTSVKKIVRKNIFFFSTFFQKIGPNSVADLDLGPRIQDPLLF